MKLAEALKINQTNPSNGKPMQVFLACSFLPLHLATFLEAHLRNVSGRSVNIHTGLYGDLVGNLERFADSEAEAGAVVIEWEDFDPRLGRRSLGGWGPALQNELLLDARTQAARLHSMLINLASAKDLAICLPTLPLPPISHQPANRASACQLQLNDIVADFALKISENGNIKILNQQELNLISPFADRLDVKSEFSTGFPYRLSHASKLGEMLASLLQPRPAKKGLITDLDDTLWRGLVGEDGPDGVSWSLDQQSHLHALYQQTLNALGESGVLIGIASKNDSGSVDKAFAREDFILNRDGVFPIEVHWQPKSESVARILATWNIGADSVIFVDDSPLELDEVKTAFPEIETWLFPTGDDDAGYSFLTKLRSAFGKDALVEEDTFRTKSIRERNDPERAKHVSPDVDAFLEQLQAELTFEVSNGKSQDARAFELINKTNQFNLNGRRLTNAQLQSTLAVPGSFLLTVGYKDKYGPLGKIAAIVGRHNSDSVHVQSWVMSCRAFSRRIEHKCVEYLFDRFSAEEIDFDFDRTDRNGPLQEFLSTVTDSELAAPVLLTRKTFMQRKPIMTHKVRELANA